MFGKLKDCGNSELLLIFPLQGGIVQEETLGYCFFLCYIYVLL